MTSSTDQRRAAPVAAPRTGRAGLASRRSGVATPPTRVPYTFLGPAIVLFTAFMAAPIVYTVYLSFRAVEVSGLGLGSGARKEVWAGLSNYTRALSDDAFAASVGRVVLYGLVLVPTMLVLALLFALLLDSDRARGRGFARVSIFLPYAVPSVVASLLWGFLYLPRVSPFIDVLDAVGLGAPDVLSPRLILFAVANIGLWGGVGFNMVVLYTSLRSIPTELFEAARLDGASESAIAVRIKVPIVAPSLVMTSIFSMIATLQVFAEPTTLRPLTNTISTTWTPLMAVYRDAFIRNDVYSAAATSVVIALATFVLSFGFLKVVGSRAFQEK